MKLSVVIPVYNEQRSIIELLHRVNDVPVEKEIVVVDDMSTDGTRDLLAHAAHSNGFAGKLRVLYQPHNMGKGAAVRRGFEEVTGDVVIVQDADLETDPRDYLRLLQPIERGETEVVYGSRFLGLSRRPLTIHFLANWGLTTLSNAFSGLQVTDMETCYKVMKRSVLQRLTLRENRFGFEPEVTARLGRLGCKVVEVPVAYKGRTRDEGKKIGWRDGIRAVWCIVRYSLFD